jgi:hypothetical protein
MKRQNVADNPDFLKYLEEKKAREPETTEERIIKKTLKALGFIFRTSFIIGLGSAAFFAFRVNNFTHIPIAQLTLENIIKAALSILFPIVCIGWLFGRDEESLAYETWGGIGLSLFAIILIGFFVISRLQ